ncbi:MAG TPA: AAA family ATPase [Candidatus Kapabacteria bacterium]|nr:AAA family ATPase [Candidatus Kapabacteria bacterium]
MENFLIDNEEILAKMRFNASQLQEGRGNIILIKGDTGFGKTHILKYLSQWALENDIVNVLVSLSAPMGNISVNTLQPYSPLIKAIEELALNKHLKPERRLAMNIGLTILATLPIAGDVFYALKELNRDIEDYKKKMKKEDILRNDPISSIWNVFKQYSEKQPFIIFFDNFHYADPQSFQFLEEIAYKVADAPILFVLSANPAIPGRSNIAYTNYLKFLELNSFDDKILELKPFDKAKIKQFVNHFFPTIAPNDEFLNWLLQKTSGIPLAISEYLQYFKDNNISITKFDPLDFDSYIPSSLQAIFASFLQKLTDDEINLLSICASEGKEFSVNLISKLLNTDVITTIKKLKAIQLKAPIISSEGAKYRYGEKTTVYQFNQSAYQIFFENLLEYEEYVAIHSQIANILKQNFDTNQDAALRNELSPLIISHSTVAGDQDKIEDVLKKQISTAQAENDQIYLQSIQHFIENYQQSSGVEQISEIGNNINPQISINYSDQEFSNLIQSKFEEPSINNLQIEVQTEKIDFDKIIDFLLSDDYENAKKYINLYINQDSSKEQKDLARLCLLKIFIDEKNEDAKILLDTLKNEIPEQEKSNRIILENLEAMYYLQQGHIDKSIEILQDTAKRAMAQDNFAKLLTLSNISIMLKMKDTNLANTYIETIEEIANRLNFQNFLDDFKTHFN